MNQNTIVKDGLIYQKIKMIILPTDDKSGIHLQRFTNQFLIYKNEHKGDEYTQSQHIYFISYEDINEGDWHFKINPNGDLVSRVPEVADKYVEMSQGHKGYVKIIATTNPECEKKVFTYYCPQLMKGVYNKSTFRPSNQFIEDVVNELNKKNKIELFLAVDEGGKYDYYFDTKNV